CWSVPEEGKAAMLANSAIEHVELWISTDPDAVPDKQSEASRRGAVFVGPIFAAEGIQRNWSAAMAPVNYWLRTVGCPLLASRTPEADSSLPAPNLSGGKAPSSRTQRER